MTVLLLISSLHYFSTAFRSEDWIGHRRSLVLCPVTHFCVVFEVCVWIIVWLEDPAMAHYKISNRVSHLLIFYLLVFDRIHDAMCLNKMSRTSSRNIGPQHKTNTAVHFIVHMGYFLSLCSPNHLECLLLKSNFFSLIWNEDGIHVQVMKDIWSELLVNELKMQDSSTYTLHASLPFYVPVKAHLLIARCLYICTAQNLKSNIKKV